MRKKGCLVSSRACEEDFSNVFALSAGEKEIDPLDDVIQMEP